MIKPNSITRSPVTISIHPSTALSSYQHAEGYNLVERLKKRYMAKLVASTFIGSGALWLYLDDKQIMQNNDTLTMELEDDIEYIVSWFVTGTTGSSYSITISSPREAQYQLTKAIGKSGKDDGGFRFKT